MKLKTRSNYLTACFILAVCCASCGGETQMNKQEQKAVETQVEKDQKAMDSLEQVIQAQINQVDSVK